MIRHRVKLTFYVKVVITPPTAFPFSDSQANHSSALSLNQVLNRRPNENLGVLNEREKVVSTLETTKAFMGGELLELDV